MSSETPLLDWRPSGDQLRDAGIALVTENSGTWMERARKVAILKLAYIPGSLITGDTIRYCVTEKIGPPHHPNAWGALTRWLIVNHHLEPTGRLVKSSRPSNHSHANPEYEVTA